MTYDSATVENDPFLIELRLNLNELETAKDATYKASEANPTDPKARLAYDAALLLWCHAKCNYEKALKSVLGL